MTKVKIIQCLCGSARHCIVAEAYEDEHAGQADEARISLSKANVSEMIDRDRINPWCGLCGSIFKNWQWEVGETAFTSMDEAMPFLQEEQRKQMETAELLRRAGRAFDVHKRN